MSTLLNLKQSVKKKGAGFIVLIDPDKKNDENIKAFYENRKSKNFAILGIIIFMVVLFFFITILRMDVTA